MRIIRKRKPGAGRKPGFGKYGEKTRTVRVPISLAEEVVAYAESKGYRIPLYENRVSAGTLTPTDADVMEMVNLNAMLVRHPADTFCVRVQGESMKDAGILPDDVLVVDRKLPHRHGSIVVVAVNGDVNVKRWWIEGGKAYLMPENETFEPIVIGAEDSVVIWGVVTGVIRSLT